MHSNHGLVCFFGRVAQLITSLKCLLNRFESSCGQTDLKSVVKKIACDEAIFAPQLAVSYLAASAYIQSPGDWGAVSENVQSKVRRGPLLSLPWVWFFRLLQCR